ncbi:MAG: amidohydrolase [Acidobacteria bacterium]|nr:amidohydrolase [Acidobacteriota bacterium]
MRKTRKTSAKAAAPEAVDLLVRGGTVLSLDAENSIYGDGAVALRGDRIVAVGPRRELERRCRARRVLDCAGRLILPGLVNAHTHAPMTLFRGVSDDQELLTWLQKYMFPLEARFVSPEFVRWGARLACWEMIASGTTTFADGYFFEEEVAKAADEAGLRAVPGQGIFDVPTPDARNAAEGLARAERFLADWQGHPRVTPALCPHSCYTVAPETFGKIRQLAARYGALVMTHLAESQGELAMVRERYGTTPVRHLAACGALDANLTVAHCVWLDDEEIGLLAARGVGVVHCAESNMKLASGVAPVPRMLEAGVALGLGTDGPASNNDLDMFGEMATVAKLHKVHTLDPTALPAETVLRLATRGGAAALHMESEIGSLEPGKKADLIVVSAEGPNALPAYNPASQLVYATRAEAVETVVVDGRILMERRWLRTLDTEAIRRHAARFARRITAALPD